MVTFLVPAALFGLALLAIPILVHLFKPRKMRQTPFSSLRWLHLTQQRLSRRIKWHQVLLFLLRFALVLLLVLAIARPVLAPADHGSMRERFVILDTSRAMGYRQPGRATPLETARQLAVDLVTHTQPGDRTTVVLAGAGAHLLGPLTSDATALVPTLQAVEAGAGPADLAAALNLLHPMLSQCRPEAEVELLFLTGNWQTNWNQGTLAAFRHDVPVPVRCRIVDVGVPAPQNAWIADVRMLEGGEPSRRWLRVQMNCVGDATQERTLVLDGLSQVPDRSQSVVLAPGIVTRAEWELPTNLTLHNEVARLRLDPPDGLSGDDVYYLPLDGRGGLGVLLLEAETSRLENLRPGFALRTAIEALAATTQAIRLTRRTTAEATAADIAAADVVLLAEVPDLADALLTALEQRVQGGGGLAIFLGPGLQPTFTNTRLYRPLQPRDGLLPAPLGAVTEADPRLGGREPLTQVRWSHPLLSRLADPLLGDLAETHWRSFYQLASPLADSDTVLAWIGTQAPALIERRLGAGKVLVLNTTANDAWSDLPRRKSYVPFVDQLLHYLSGSGTQHVFALGEGVVMALPAGVEGPITVVAPSGQTLLPTLTATSGRTLLRVDAALEPGVYAVRRAGQADDDLRFVVQSPRADSPLTPAEPTTLTQWWEPIPCRIEPPETLQQELAAQPTAWTLVPVLVALACLMLLAEMFLVHWLCPRAPVLVAAPVVRPRGLHAADS